MKSLIPVKSLISIGPEPYFIPDIDRDAVRKYATWLYKHGGFDMSWIECVRDAFREADKEYLSANLLSIIKNEIPEIPEYSAEKIQEMANKNYNGDTEKVATTPLEFLDFRGIRLMSRYDKAFEYRDMMRMVAALDIYGTHYADLIKGIFCDSNACATYTFYLREDYYRDPDSSEWKASEARDYWEEDDFWSFRRHIAEIAMVNSGHNGIYFDWADSNIFGNNDDYYCEPSDLGPPKEIDADWTWQSFWYGHFEPDDEK